MSEIPPPLHDPIHAAGFAGPAAFGIEDGVINAVLWLKLGVEAIGALVIGIGVIAATWQFVRTLLSPRGKDYNQIRDAGPPFGAGARVSTRSGYSVDCRGAQLGSDRQTGRHRGAADGVELFPDARNAGNNGEGRSRASHRPG